MPTKIKYKGSTIASLEAGEIGTISCNDKEMEGDITVIAPEAEESAVPTEVSTEAEMTALLESGEVGGVYKYTGETGTYENGAMYVLEEEAAEDALAGTWVFNETIDALVMDIALNFVSNGTSYTGIKQTAAMGAIFYLMADGTADSAYKGGAWNNEAFRTIEVTTLLENVVVNSGDIEGFMAWLQSNATKQ